MGLKKMSKTTLFLIIVLAALLVSMVGTSFVQTSAWSVKETNYTVTLSEVETMITDNVAENGRVVEVLFDGDEAAQISFDVFVPKNASENNQVPVIIGAHGYNNSKEMQLSNFTELARRGFVVIVFDLAGHGRTDITVDDYTQGTEGMLAIVEYAMSLSYVDINKIGITGHSAGDLDAVNTLNIINTPTSLNHISAFFCPTGTLSALFVSPTATDNLILGVASGKYDELDTHYFGTYEFLSAPLASTIIQKYFPTFTGVVTEGQYYDATGPIDSPAAGQAIDVTEAVAIWNPPITHPQGTFSRIATELTIDFFYTSFGVPEGADYIAATNQVWPVAVVFQTLGLLAFFASAFAIGASLLKRPAFSDLSDVVTQQADLPSIKSWKEWLPLVLTFIPLVIFPYIMYFKLYDVGSKLFNPENYPMETVNGIAWFTLVMGLFMFVMLFVNYGIKRLVHLKDGVKVESVFAPLKVKSGSHFWKIVKYSTLVLVLMYIPCYIAYHVFHMNFGIAVYTVGLPRYEWLPDILIKYLPFWLVFLIPNAVLNNNTRFKEIPEWASTLFIAVANFLPIAVLTFVNYRTLFTTGHTEFTFGDPSIFAWNFFAPMILIALTGRYFYKKTGNSWSGILIAATIIAMMALTLTRHTSPWMFNF